MINKPAKQELLSIHEAAALLKISTKTLRRWEAKGILVPERTEGKHRRYRFDEIISLKKNKNTKKKVVNEAVVVNTIAPKEVVEMRETPVSIQTPQTDKVIAFTTPQEFFATQNASQIETPTKTVRQKKHTVKNFFAKSLIVTSLLLITATAARAFTPRIQEIFSSKRETAKLLNSANVLADTTALQDLTFNLNVPTKINANLFVGGDATTSGNLNVKGNVVAEGPTNSIAGILTLTGNQLSATGDLTITPLGGGVRVGTAGNASIDLAGGDLFIQDQLQVGTSITLGGDTIADFVGTGLTVVNGTLQSSIGTTVEGSEISDNTITEAKLTVSNDASNGKLLSYNSSTGGFTWVSQTTDTTPFQTTSNVANLITSTDDVTIGAATDLGKLAVVGDTDETQLLARAYSTQTSNIFAVQNSSGTNLFTVNNSGNLTTAGSLTLNSDAISDFTGNGLTLSSGALTIQLPAATDALSSTTTSGSGLEVLSSGLTLLQGCADGQILKWNETTDMWGCSNDTGASSAIINVKNNGVAVGTNVDTLNFTTDFTITESPSGTDNIAVADDILNFSEFSDSLVLDASTSIAFGASNYNFTFTNNGTGDEVHNLSSTGDLAIQDNGTAFATFDDAGGITFAPNGTSDFTVTTDSDSTLHVTGLQSGSGSALCLDGSNNLVTCTTGAGGIAGSGTSGQIAYFNGATSIASEATGFSWDATNNKLGIGTDTPDGVLHVTGAAVGKALAIFNETGDQNIVTASASGVTQANITRTGFLNLAAGGGVDTLAAGALNLGTTNATSAVIGSSSLGSLTVTTNGTGDSEIVLPSNSIGNAELVNSSITFAGDSGSSATSLGGTRTIAGGTNGIDTSESAGTLTLNLDTTEIGSTTFGSGSATTWTFDASAGTDTTLAFGNNSSTFTGNTFTVASSTTNADSLALVPQNATATNSFTGTITSADLTAARTWTLPDTSGTVILSGHTFTGDVTGTLGSGGTTALTVSADAVALGTDTTGNYVATISGNSQIAVSGSGSENAAVSLSISANSIDTTQLAATLTFSDGDLVDLSSINGSSTAEGLKLPQNASACSAQTAEGQICWDSSADTLYIGNGSTASAIGGGSSFTSFTAAGDSGGGQTISSGNTLSVLGGTNGIDTADSATDTITLNLDTTEIGSTTFGSGSAITWTFDASAGTDTTIAFGNNTQTLTAGTVNVTGNADISGTLFAGTGDAFQVSGAGAVTAVGVNSGSGLIQGTGGETITGTTQINVNASTNTTAIGTGTTSGAITLGGGSNTLAIDTTSWDVSSAGAISGLTGFTQASGAFSTTLTTTNAATFSSSTTNADSFAIKPQSSTATNSFTGTLTSADLTANRTWTIPDATGTVCLDTGNCAGSGGGITGSGTSGQITYFNGSGTITSEASGFSWDATNNKLGIGTDSPNGVLHVTSAATGKALAIFNETGDQNILTASASGTTVASINRSGQLTLNTTTANADKLALVGNATGSNTFTGSVTTADLTGDQTWTFPNDTGTVCLTTGNCAGVGGVGTMNNFTAAGDSGSNQTISDGNTLTIAGGTNGIDTVGSATDTITLNLDTTEITNATFGAGSGYTWTFDAGATDPTIAFASDQITIGGASTLSATGVTTFNCTDCINFDDMADSMTLDASTSIATGNSLGLSVTSDLSGGARSTYPFTISQANDGSNNNSVGLLSVSNSDTGSTAAALSISQVAGGNGIDITGIQSGAGISMALGLNSGGTGISFSSAYAITDAYGILFQGSGVTTSSFQGAYFQASPTRIYQGAGTLGETGNFLKLARTDTQNTGAGTIAITGDVATFSSTCSASGGTCTDSSNIISAAQNYTSATGAVVDLTNAGTGQGVLLTSSSTGDLMELDSSGAVTTANGLLIAASHASGVITDAVDVSDAEIVNAVNAGANVILGTTATIDFSNFDVASTGNVTVAAGQGLDTNGAGALALGNTNATSVSVCNSAACDTLSLGTNADADTITVGDSTDTVGINGSTTVLGTTAINTSGSAATNIGTGTSTGTITIGLSSGTDLALADANWNVTGAGAANFASIGATTRGTALFTTLGANGNVTIGDANTDTLTINAGSSGSGISFGDSSFTTCSALTTVAGVLTCGSAGGSMSSFTAAGDSGSNQTISDANTLTIAGGTNGIDTVGSATDTITLNLDTTEIGTTTFGSGSAITWTFDASAGTDTTIAYGNNTITATAGTFNVTGNADVSGTLFAGTGDAFQVSSSGAVTAVGVNSGSGLIQGTGGITATGAVSINASASTNTTAIGTGTTSGAITLGGGSNTLAIDTTSWDVSTAGVASGLTGITSSGTINFSGLTASSGVYTDGSKNLTSTPPTSGTLGYWSRTGTTLSPSNSGDAVTTSGNISTTGTGTITSAGLLTGSAGLTVSGAAVSLNASSNFATSINTGTSTGAISLGNSLAGAVAISTGSTFGITTTTSPQTFTSANVSGATTSSAFVFTDNALTTGTGAYINSSSVTSGNLLSLASTSTALTSGKLASFDWSPGSATTATGDLFNINIGTNGTTTGNIFSVSDTGSNLFSVSETGITANVPAAFNAAGDVTMAYDLQFTNQTASFIKALGPLTLDAGESFESNDLTLKTYNSGRIIGDVSNSGGMLISSNPAGVSSIGLLNIDGSATGKALAVFNESGDQNILTASASGTTVANIARTGTISVAAGQGIDTLAAGALALGNTTATSVSICNSAACDTLSLGTNADADTITIGDTLDTFSLASTGLNVSTAGALSGITGFTQTSGAFSSILTTTNSALFASSTSNADKIALKPQSASTGAQFTATISTADLTVGDQTFNFPDLAAATSATVCVSTGNCAGLGTGVTQSGTNASGQIAYFTSSNDITSSSTYLLVPSTATGNTLALTNTSLTTGKLTSFTGTNTAVANTALTQNLFAVTNAQGTTANTNGVVGLGVNFTNNPTVAGNTEYAAQIQNQVTANATDNAVAALLRLDNADTNATGSTVVTDALQISNSGAIAAGVTNGIAFRSTTIDTGINFVSTPTTNYISGTNWSVTAAGAETLAGDIAVNGGDITATGDLTITPAGGDVFLANAVTLNIGGSGSDVAYNLIGDNTTGANAALASDNDLLIQGDAQVVGSLWIESSGSEGGRIYGSTGDNMTFDGANRYYFSAANDTGNLAGASSSFTIDTGSLTTGTGLEVTASGASQTSDKLVEISQTGITTGFTGNLLNLTSTSTTGAATFINLTANASTVGVGEAITMNALTSGKLLSLASSSSSQSTGKYIDIAQTGVTTGYTGNLINLSSSSTTGAATFINLTANASTVGVGEGISMTALTTGTGLSITGGSAMAAGGELIDAVMGAATAGNGINISTTGVYTGTGLETLTANSLTSGTMLSLASSGASQSTAKYIDIAQTGVTTGFTGNLINLSSSSTTGAATFINLAANSSTTGTGLGIAMNALTTGKGISVASSGSSQSTDTLLDLSQTGVTTGYTGNLVNISSSSTTGAATFLNLTANASTVGTGEAIAMNALTTGKLLSLASSSSSQTTGKFIDIAQTGVTTGFTGNLINLSSSSTTGAATFINLAANSSTTGIGQAISMNALTTGSDLSLTSSSTALTSGTLFTSSLTGASAFTGNLNYMDWTPGSSTTASGDLFRVHIGPNGTTTGYLLNVVDDTSSVFSVSESAVTSALPTSFTAAGDVSMAYDLQFTNQTSSYIKSNAPLTLDTGESFESNSLTLQTYNVGNILLNTGSSSTGTGKVGVGPSVTPVGLLHVSNVNENAAGLIGKALAIFDQAESQDILTASKSGTTRFSVNNAGNTFVTLRNTATFGVCHVTNGAGYDELTDCSGSVGADYMEMYPVDQTADKGTIVTTSTDYVTTTQGQTISKLVPSTGAYQSNVIGIMSDPADAGDFNSTGYNIKPEDNPQPVALNGRVQVKISNESEAIQPGDFITTSHEAGRGMKATGAGVVIAKALDSWTPNSGKDTVMVFVQNTWFDPIAQNQTASGSADLSTLTAQINTLTSDFNATVGASLTASSSGILANFDKVNTNNLVVLGDTTLANTVINGTLNVGAMTFDNVDQSINAVGVLKIQSLALGNIEFEGGLVTIDTEGNVTANSITAGKYKVAGASAGTNTLTGGATEIFVSSTAVTNNSLIFVTPKQSLNYPLAVTERQEGVGFKVTVSQSELNNIDFDWFILDKTN